MELTEKNIIKKIQEGEIEYFESFVKKYSRVLYSYARLKVKKSDDAEDLVQNSFIKSYKAIDRFDLNKTFYPFIFSILKNEIIDFYRKQKFEVKLNDEISSNDKDIDTNHLDIEILFNKIKKEHKEVLKFYYLEGLSYKEISRKLNKPINTIKTLLRRAKIQTKEVYEK